jgi:hypothetical protein
MLADCLAHYVGFDVLGAVFHVQAVNFPFGLRPVIVLLALWLAFVKPKFIGAMADFRLSVSVHDDPHACQ